MSLSTLKSIPLMIGIIAVLALAGIVSGTMLMSTTTSTDAPPTAGYIDIDQDQSYEPAPFEPSSPTAASVTTYTRFPQVMVDQDARGDLTGSDTLAAVSRNAVSQQDTMAAPPVAVSIAPGEDWNPIFSQHTFTVTVSGEGGTPANGVEVEVFLNRFGEAVGDIVSLGGENPRKVDNHFGRVITDENGQATLTITATRTGDTDVTAYVPQIEDDSTHKVFAVKHWVDMNVEFPPDSVNLVGTDHPMLVRISKVTDGAPLSGVGVSWAIIDSDPAATVDGAQDAVTTTTNENGETVVTLQQVTPSIGDNQVLIQVMEEGTGKTMFSHTHTKQWQSPTLEVNKEGPDNLGLRKTAEYSVTVTNSGDTTATNVTLTDDLPTGLTFVSSDPAATSSDGSTITWSLGDIPAGESMTVTMVLSAASIGEQINTATAVSVEGITGQDTSLTSVIPGSISMAKAGPAETILGDDITYDITVTNDGEGGLTSIVVTDILPETLTYVSSNPAASVGADGTISWLIDTLDSAASAMFSLVATSGEPGEVVNTTTAEASEGASATAQATTLVTKADLSITKAPDNSSPLVGAPTSFSIGVTNNGNAVASNVVVTDTMPAGLQFVSSEPNGTFGEDGSLNLDAGSYRSRRHGNHRRQYYGCGGWYAHQYCHRHSTRRNGQRGFHCYRTAARDRSDQGRRFGTLRGRPAHL